MLIKLLKFVVSVQKGSGISKCSRWLDISKQRASQIGSVLCRKRMTILKKNTNLLHLISRQMSLRRLMVHQKNGDKISTCTSQVKFY